MLLMGPEVKVSRTSSFVGTNRSLGAPTRGWGWQIQQSERLLPEATMLDKLTIEFSPQVSLPLVLSAQLIPRRRARRRVRIAHPIIGFDPQTQQGQHGSLPESGETPTVPTEEKRENKGNRKKSQQTNPPRENHLSDSEGRFSNQVAEDFHRLTGGRWFLAFRAFLRRSRRKRF